MRKIINKKSTYSPWTTEGERLLLYADVMGFKSRVATRSHKQLKGEILDFRSAWDAKTSCLKLGDYLKFVQFSDSMLLVVQGVDSKMFNLLTQAAVCLMQTAMEKGFPIKGAISQGLFTLDNEKLLHCYTNLFNIMKMRVLGRVATAFCYTLLHAHVYFVKR